MMKIEVKKFVSGLWPYALRTALLLLALNIIACSHSKPYFRKGLEICEEPCAPDAPIESRVILIGDTGELKRTDEPILMSLYDAASDSPEKTAIVFLGDNIYPAGILPADAGDAYEESVTKLTVQLQMADSSGAQSIFVPGNHDWDYSGEDGLNAIKRQAKIVDEFSPRTRLLPEDGCPGPAVVDLEGVRLIILDSEWWLRTLEKPISECIEQLGVSEGSNGMDSTRMVEQWVLAELQELVSTSGDRAVLIAAHHPLASHGPHGGFFDWKDYFFPLTALNKKLWIPSPVLLGGLTLGLGELTGLWEPEVAIVTGALAPFVYPVGRGKLLKPDQDLSGGRNKHFMRELSRTLQDAEREGSLILYAAGHDHALQVLEGSRGTDFVLVSGAGSKISKVGHGDDTLFAHAHQGFMVIDILESGQALLRVIEPDDSEDGSRVLLSYWLN